MSQSKKPQQKKNKRDPKRIVMSVLCLLLVVAMLGSLVLTAIV